jgi:hypothetical protein
MNNTPDSDREEDDRLLRLMEAATAPRDDNEPAHLAERDEYASLRASWLALGRLLDAAGEAPRIEARSEKVETRRVSEENKPLPRAYADKTALSDSIRAHRASHQRKLRRLRRFTAIVAVGAAACVILLVAGNFGLNWWLARAARQMNQGPVAGPAQPPIIKQQQDAAKGPATIVMQNEKQAPPHNANTQKQAATVVKTSTWDDAIDQQIASVSQQIDSVRHTWGRGVDDVDLVQYGVDEVSAGMTKDAL